MTTSPDGRQVFVAGYNDNALVVFDRDANSGQLTLSTVFKDGVGGVDGLEGATSVTTSVDGRQVFVAGERDNSLAVFNRNTSSGQLTFSEAFKDGVGGVDGLEGATSVTTSADGRQVFVTGGTDNALAVFNRDRNSGDLAFSKRFQDGLDGVDGLAGASAVTMSAGGTQVLVTGYEDDALAVFNRNVNSGALTFEQALKDGVNGIDGLDGASAVTASPDGKQVFVSGAEDGAVTVFNTQAAPDTSTPGQIWEIPPLGNSNAISIGVERSNVDSVSEVFVFFFDDNSNERIEVGSFSLLEGGQLPNEYAPTLTFGGGAIEPGDRLQFELMENGNRRIANVTFDDDGQTILDFGQNTQLKALLATETFRTNLLSDDATTIDLSDELGSVDMTFTIYREADYDNTVGFYRMADIDGSVIDSVTGNRLRPGDAGYKSAAIAQRIDINLTGQNDQVTTFNAQLFGETLLGTFLIADGSDAMASDVYFAHAEANSGGNDHVKLLGSNTFGFEDLAGLGDRDFNDVVVKFDVV